MKIVDGSQFLSPFLILMFSNSIWKIKMVWAQNVQTGHQGDLKNKAC